MPTQELIHKVDNLLYCMVVHSNQRAGHKLPPPILLLSHPLSMVVSYVATTFHSLNNEASYLLCDNFLGGKKHLDLIQLFFPEPILV
jgi:hypothetical protein